MKLYIFQLRVSNSKEKKKSLPIELVTRSDLKWFSLVLNFELVTQNWKTKSLIIELVTWSEVFYFSKPRVSNLKEKEKFKTLS